MKAKSIILIMIALGCGLVASIGISQVMVQDGNAEAPKYETCKILVAMKLIDIAAPLDAENVKLEEWPKELTPEGAVTSMEEIKDKFSKARVESYLKEAAIDYDIVSAVCAVAWRNPGVALQRARVIQKLRGDNAFELLITGAKRVSNILSPDHKKFGVDWSSLDGAFAGSGSPDPDIRFDADRFEDDAERELHRRIQEVLPQLRKLEAASDEVSFLKMLSALGPDIDTYFDLVLVNCPDAALRSQRHRFLAAVFSLFAKYADLSHIVEQGTVAVS